MNKFEVRSARVGDIVQIFGRAKYAPPDVRISHKMLGTIVGILGRDRCSVRTDFLVLLEDHRMICFFDDEFTILFTGNQIQNHD